MRALDLDFARPHGRRLDAGWYVLIAGTLAVTAVTYGVTAATRQAADLESQLTRVERRPSPSVRATASARANPALADQIVFANMVAERLTFRWQDLFKALERSGGRNVALLALEPDVVRSQVRITAEARTKADMLAYAARLGAEKALRGAYIREHRVMIDVPGTPVRFTVEAGVAKADDER